MIHLYTGDGKGKTTAATGLAVRALGQGWRVVFVQFLKGGESGELDGLRRLGARIHRLSRPFGFWLALNAAERRLLAGEHDRLLQIVAGALDAAGERDLTVLDEFACVLDRRMASRHRLAAALRALRRSRGEVVVTGRGGVRLRGIAGYVSEIVARRHPYDAGLPARRGIEF